MVGWRKFGFVSQTIIKKILRQNPSCIGGEMLIDQIIHKLLPTRATDRHERKTWQNERIESIKVIAKKKPASLSAMIKLILLFLVSTISINTNIVSARVREHGLHVIGGPLRALPSIRYEKGIVYGYFLGNKGKDNELLKRP